MNSADPRVTSAARTEDEVACGMECPECGEAEMDLLIWTEADTVICQRCGTEYDPRT